MRTILSTATAIIVSATVLYGERSVPAEIPLPRVAASGAEQAVAASRADNLPAGTHNSDPTISVRTERIKLINPVPAAMQELTANRIASAENDPASIPENRQTNPEHPVSRTMTVMATGYSSGPGAVTFTGTSPYWGEVAVDPRFIPLDSLMKIPEFPGVIFKAEDTGGLVKGFHIDIWFPSKGEAVQWGVRYIQVQLLK